MPTFTKRQAQMADELIAQLGLDRIGLLMGERQRQSYATIPQPPITITISPEDWAAVADYWHTPIQEEETGCSGIDVLCQAVNDAVDSGSCEETLFAALRLSRKMWQLQPHLGPIEGIKTQAALPPPEQNEPPVYPPPTIVTEGTELP